MHRAVVTRFEIAGRDAEALKRFYGRLFGWRIRSDDCGAHSAYRIDPDGAGTQTAIRGASPIGVIPYVEVNDVLENLCYAEELGGRILELPHEITSGGRDVTVALFADPEGNRLGLSLAEELAEGDQLELRGPIGGYFVWDVKIGGTMLLIACGSGVCPLMAMLRHRTSRASLRSMPQDSPWSDR